MNLELDYLPFYVFCWQAFWHCCYSILQSHVCCVHYLLLTTSSTADTSLAAYAVPLALSTLTGYIQYIMTISYACTTMIDSDSFFNIVALISVFMYLLLIWKGGNTSLQCAMKRMFYVVNFYEFLLFFLASWEFLYLYVELLSSLFVPLLFPLSLSFSLFLYFSPFILSLSLSRQISKPTIETKPPPPPPPPAQAPVTTNNHSHTSKQSLPPPTVTAPVKSRGGGGNGEDDGEISADELLANIQSVVDELHLDYSSSNGASPEVR